MNPGTIHKLLAGVFFGWLSYYYLTGVGGPMMLAVVMVPLATALAFLNEARRGELPTGLALSLAVAAVAAVVYLIMEFESIRIYRVGLWNIPDLLAGGAVATLVLEYTRRKYFPLFVINTVLALYAVYGWLLPGAMRHSGIDWTRVVSVVSLEMSTGVFDRLAQLGLTLIGSFILVLAALRAFGCIDSILQGSARIAAQRPSLLPQAAVVGSFAIAAVSGSGAANAATTGTATIPALMRSGLPRIQSAAIETASSLGGQLMPPLMGIAAFMMAELMGVGYFEVAIRGFGPALIYFFGVSFAVYLLARRHRPTGRLSEVGPLDALGRLRIAAYVLSVLALILLMGIWHKPAMTAAQIVFAGLVIGLGGNHLLSWFQNRGEVEFWRPFGKLVETFSDITSELVVLLATLGILTALFTVTGIPTKVGILVMEMASVHVVLMVLTALLFGVVVGMGLPAAPTYIILAVVIAPFMISAGMNPWVVHFFAFFVAVFGELTPPTSVTAAVAARIADAPFMPTMFAALRLCLPLLIMIGAVFTRPELVMTPGWGQLIAAFTVLSACLGLTATLDGMPAPFSIIMLLAAALALIHPSTILAASAALIVVALLLFRFLGLDTEQK